MTREEIIRIAKDSGCYREDCGFAECDFDAVMRFASLVAVAEREACAALHDSEDVLAPVGQSAWGEAYQDGWIAGVSAYREAIRARGANESIN